MDWKSEYKGTSLRELKTHISHTGLKTRQNSNKKVLELFRSKLNLLQGQFFYPHLFFLVDLEGIVLDIHGEDSLYQDFEPLIVRPGSAMSMESGGINAISIAIKTGENIFLEGDEHQLSFFKSWLCLCSPIKVQGEIVAFLNFSRHTPFVYDSIFALVSSIVASIEYELELEMQTHNQIDNLFDTYCFTAREREVANLWLQNKGALYIGEKLGITEGTVRNFVKKIYMKSGVNDRGGFMKKFY
ncbi:LuxR C-terminal-related transcriptional regulator [Paenibacillus sp. RRE4]|uniref:helix-turn-helix transcriptional regulator n=1 Tax=Paenibacillus sp. RRE4 TaxID=2962587 RepID=UPI002882B849|nr:LuxR C-terminal-related transcriptional regulator [Paenibacillus sp. RRE4]MDT0124768.1 LuxR C-terminal-related transcriptional regulator [Paenibacillus sp. RRE4]